jgi:NADPH:quinone reductase-like Zn-dependent oxidoreductase
MKTFEIRQSGIDNLVLADRLLPAPGPGQVLIKLRAASLNYRDLLVTEGNYDPRMALPRVPLSDGAGDVVEVGENVTRLRKKDRVASIFMSKWLTGEVDEEKAQSALGGAIDGVASEYIVLDDSAVVRIPDYLNYEEAATLPCAAVTAWHALIVAGQLQRGESVLTLGSGGVSCFAVQFAKMVGTRVIATSSSDEKLERLSDLGASDGINYKTKPDWEKEVRSLTQNRGVDHIVEVGGAGTLPRSMKAVRMGGTIAVIGILTGGGDANFVPVLMRTIRINGIYVGSREMFEEMIRVMSSQQMRPVIDKTFEFEQLPEALQYMKTGQHFGKICLSFPD